MKNEGELFRVLAGTAASTYVKSRPAFNLAARLLRLLLSRLAWDKQALCSSGCHATTATIMGPTPQLDSLDAPSSAAGCLFSPVAPWDI